MNETAFNKNDELVMKLLHFFITEQGYNPIVLHGAKNEIWLENLEGEYGIIRIVSNYIHNDEQFNFDIFKTTEIMRKIKKKTLTFNVKAISIFINLGDNVHFNDEYGNIRCADIKDINDLNKYGFIIEQFPTITKKTNFKEKGVELFMKLTSELNEKSQDEAQKAEDIFKIRKPIMTYIIIALNTLVFIGMYLLGSGSYDIKTLLDFGASHPDLIKAGEYYRLVTSSFIHIGIIHFLFNNYALYLIGPQLESFFGKTKFILIYLFSAVIGNLMSMLFTNSVGAGASGAIFGLLGALLYFGYHYRVYLGSVIKSQIIPLIIINLLIGFSFEGIDNAAHIGGLIGGTLISIAFGVKYKSTAFEKINGWIITIIFTLFLIYMTFIGV